MTRVSSKRRFGRKKWSSKESERKLKEMFEQYETGMCNTHKRAKKNFSWENDKNTNEKTEKYLWVTSTVFVKIKRYVSMWHD